MNSQLERISPGSLYLKALPDNTVTLITADGRIVGKFDSPDEAEDILLEQNYGVLQTTPYRI